MQRKNSEETSVPDIFNTVSRTLVINLIRDYQKFLSPHKGFSCAYRVLHGGESCSQYFKRVVGEDGILIAISSAKNRFRECREANENLKLRRKKYKSQRNYYASQIDLAAIQAGGGKPREDQAGNFEKKNNKIENGCDSCDCCFY